MEINRKSRLDMVDLTKLILAFMVVAIHTYLLGEYIYPFVRLAVPAFFIFTGYFTFRKIDFETDKKVQNNIFQMTLKRYIILYMVWFIILLPYTIDYRGYFNCGVENGIKSILHAILTKSTFPASWYLMASVYGIVAVYLLSRKLSNKSLLLIAVPCYLAATVYSEFYYVLQNILPSGVYDVCMKLIEVFGEPCFNGVVAIIYIVIGKMIADGEIGNRTAKIYGYGFIGILVILLGEYFFMKRYEFFVYTSDCLIFLAPTVTLFVLWIMNIHIEIPHAKMFRNMSTIIYCIHVPIYETLIIYLNKFGIPNPEGMTGFILTVVITSVIASIIIKLEKCQYLHILQYTH